MNKVQASVQPATPCISFVAIALFIGAASGWTITWHPLMVATLLVAMCIPLYWCHQQWLRHVSFANVAFVLGMALSSQQMQADKEPFFLDSDVQIQRVVLSEFGQSISVRSTTVHYPSGLHLRQRLHAYVPAAPVYRVDDVYRVRGLCEWNERYHSWQLRIAESQLVQAQAQSPRAHLWRHVHALAPHQGLGAALLLGSAPRAAKQQFRQAGIAHVLVVSGLHVGIVFVLMAAFLRGAAVPWYPAQFLLIGILCYYLWMTGFAIPTQRAVLMGIVIIGANLIGRDLHPYAALSVSVILLVLWDPLSARSLSFQLSAAAVAGILSLGLSLRRLRVQLLPLQAWPLDRPLWKGGLYIVRGGLDAFVIGLAATIAVTPILAFHIGVCNPWSPIATVLITPLVTISIALGGLWMACMGLWHDGPWTGVYVLCDWSFSALNEMSTCLGYLPASVMHVSAPPFIVLCCWPCLLLPLAHLKSCCWRALLLIGLIIIWCL